MGHPLHHRVVLPVPAHVGDLLLQLLVRGVELPGHGHLQGHLGEQPVLFLLELPHVKGLVVEHGTRSLVRRGEDDEKFATVADIEQFLSEQAKFRKNTVSGKFEVLMADCGEEYAELTDRYVNTLWSRMNKAGMLARIADIRSVLDSEYTPLFNPFVAYLEGLPAWDGTTDPIARLAAGVHVKDDQKLFGIYFKKWLVATMLRCSIPRW